MELKWLLLTKKLVWYAVLFKYFSIIQVKGNLNFGKKLKSFDWKGAKLLSCWSYCSSNSPRLHPQAQEQDRLGYYKFVISCKPLTILNFVKSFHSLHLRYTMKLRSKFQCNLDRTDLVSCWTCTSGSWHFVISVRKDCFGLRPLKSTVFPKALA